ncbi:MAG: hypothetical protein WCG94_09430, partial [Methanothrix sp.]
MVDLFGKKKLEDRILEMHATLAKLEGEKEDLSRTLEKRMRRFAGSPAPIRRQILPSKQPSK